MKKNIGPKLGIYPTPVVVVGTYDHNDVPNLVTLAWAGICCSEPPSVQISIRKSRYSHRAITERKMFSVNLPSAKYLTETDYCGLVSGKEIDKFEVTGLTPVRGESLDVPLVLEFPISMECRLTHTLELGSHDLFVGQIVSCWAEDTLLHETGKLDPKRVDPITFMPSGEYFGIGALLAQSHSLGKKLIAK